MMINVYTGTMLLAAFLAAVSQLLLKLSARAEHRSKIFEYLNIRVILGYGLLVLTMVMNIWAYQGVPYKLGPILNAASYVFVMILGRLVLKEKITVKKAIGICLIVAGIWISAALG